MQDSHSADVVIVGAGAFGSWTAWQLHRAGAKVILIDAYGAANSRASSGGESRILRMGYGPDAIYTQMAQHSLVLWRELFDKIGRPQLFQPTGVLWFAREADPYCEATLKTFNEKAVEFQKLSRTDLDQRYPQFDFGPVAWGMLEKNSGVVLARQAVQALVSIAVESGVSFIQGAVQSPRVANERVSHLEISTGETIVADNFVFACGPWLPKVFPDLLADLIHVTRQEVFFLGVPSGDHRFKSSALPAWIDFNDLAYGIPDLENRGFKIAIDEHGPPFDPDTGERVIGAESIAGLRAYLQNRLPALRDAPIVETRVCQYENTSNGDFLIDKHPAFQNVWLVGGGSGHGFKHGPAVGELAVKLISSGRQAEPRFSLDTKEKLAQRQVY